MAFTEKHKTLIDIIQWVMIALLIATCVYVFIGKRNAIRERDIAKDEAYIKIYQTQTIEDLKKKNKELYDSITSMSTYGEPESALQIKYKYVTKTDTITKTQFVQGEDSIYHYVSDNDTIRTEIDVKAKDFDWCKTSTTINDKFTIITRKGSDGTMETTVGHSSNVEVEKVDAWRKKTTFKDRISVGPSVGVGYGLFNKKFDAYVGVSVSIRLN